MRRTILTLIASALALATSASAASATSLPTQPQTFTGTLSALDGYSFDVQTEGRAVGVISALTRAANTLAGRDLPYVWGGGHAEAGIASIGEKGPGFNGRSRGYDCSGSVAAVLAGGGLWPTGGGVPNDAGVISYLLSKHLIAKGAGTGPAQVTLYDDPDVHIFMNIDGRFFGTSDGGSSGDARGGPGWLDVGADVTSGRFKRYHFLPGTLGGTTTAGSTVGFEDGVGLGLMDYPVGTKVKVSYMTTASGMLVADAVTPVGEVNANATIKAIGASGQLTLVNRQGRTLHFNVSEDPQLLSALQGGELVVGDKVAIGYVGTPSTTLTLISLTVTATPAPPVSTVTTPVTTVTTPTVPTTTTTTTTGTTTGAAPVTTVIAPPAETSASGGSGLG